MSQRVIEIEPDTNATRANNNLNNSAREFTCIECARNFPTKPKLTAHVKDCHPVNKEDLQCPHCRNSYASIRSRKDHEPRCPQQKKQVWVPTAQLVVTKVNHRHTRDKNTLSESGMQVIELFRTYLEAGSTSTFMLGRGKKNLEGASVSTYAYHMRDYLNFLEKSETEEFDHIEYFLNSTTIKDYLKHQQDSQYTMKTMLNRLFALERFCGFVEEKLPELISAGLTKLKPGKRATTKITDSLTFITAQITTVSPLAQAETKVRNCRESLEAADKWIAIKDLFAKEFELKEEMDILIERFSKATIRPAIEDLVKVQEYIIFLMVTLRPPMRTQNLELAILAKLESPIEAKSNGIVFNAESVILQYSKFKTKKSYGFVRFKIDDPLASYLRKYNEHVRPWFFESKAAAPKINIPLFVTKKGTAVKNIGEVFKKIMIKYFGKPVTVGTIRKVMETALSESNLQESEKNNLSNAMLHDPATAQEYYIAKDYVTASDAINAQWKQFRSAFTANTNVSAPAPVAISQPNSVSYEAIQLIDCPISPILSVPSLVTSPMQSEEVSFEDCQEQHVARVVDSLFHARSNKATKFQLQPGDWNCSMCNYTNFARRLVCNRCGKDKNKRGAYEEVGPEKKKQKTTNDITAVLKKSVDKAGQVIYKVNSSKRGELWVSAKHVPANLL